MSALAAGVGAATVLLGGAVALWQAPKLARPQGGLRHQGGLALMALGVAAAGAKAAGLQAALVIALTAAVGWLLATTADPQGKAGRFCQAGALLGAAGLPPLPGWWGRILLVVAALQVGGVAGSLAAALSVVLTGVAVSAAAKAVRELYGAPAKESAGSQALPASLLGLYLLVGLLPGPLLHLATWLAAAMLPG